MRFPKGITFGGVFCFCVESGQRGDAWIGGCAPEIGNKKAARRRLSCAMEPATGLEPVTPALRERCSTN